MNTPTKEQVDSALEIARCAEVNLNNLAHGNPAIQAHPFFNITKTQIQHVVARLEGKPEETYV